MGGFKILSLSTYSVYSGENDVLRLLGVSSGHGGCGQVWTGRSWTRNVESDPLVFSIHEPDDYLAGAFVGAFVEAGE